MGRKKEFDYFLGEWYEDLERNFAQSQAILARRKKGKTAFLQRYFNLLWSNAESKVIPFYYTVQDIKMTQAGFAKDFFSSFARQYLSFTERKPDFIDSLMPFEKLKGCFGENYFRDAFESILDYEKTNNWDMMWKVASRTPFEIAVRKGIKIVQIIDEFQNINQYIFDQRGEKIDSMSGSYRDLSEKKEAPLIVSGSEVHGLTRIIRELTGRFREHTLENLPEEEAKEAIQCYADFKKTKIDEEAKEKIWNLTQGDPLYIKALMTTKYNNTKDYTHEDNIIDVYQKEISQGEIFNTWMEYILNIFVTVNERNAKRIMLYLFQAGEERTRAQIYKDLNLGKEQSTSRAEQSRGMVSAGMNDPELEQKLYDLIRADLISHGSTDFRYKIAKDKTYELVFRKLYQDEIDNFVPDLRKEIRKEMGRSNYEKGKFREFLVKETLKKPFNLKDITENGIDLVIKPKNLIERHKIKIGIHEREIDLVVQGNPELWIDVKDIQSKYGNRQTQRWLEIKEFVAKQNKDIMFLVFAQNGYTKEAEELLKAQGVYILKSPS